MKESNERRVNNCSTFFALFSGILSFGHIVILLFSVQLARDLDKSNPQFKDTDLEFWLNMPFVIGLSLFALFQLFASIFILMFNSHAHKIRSTYYAAILGMISSFAIAVYLGIQAIQMNALTRSYPKDQDPFPKLIPLYWSYLHGVLFQLIFIFPMMSFIFYHKLEKYLAIQREKNQRKSSTEGYSLVLFLLQNACNFSVCVNLLSWSDIQDKKDYGIENAVDIYIFYFLSAFFIQLVAICIQLHNLRKHFLTKKQNMILATIVGIFQMSSLFVLGIKAGQFFAQFWVLGDTACKYEDCDADNVLKWQLFAYFVANLVCMLVQICYLKQVSLKVDPHQNRDTLITAEDMTS